MWVCEGQKSMCVRAHACTHVCVCVFMWVCAHMYVEARSQYVSVCLCTCVRSCGYVHTCMEARSQCWMSFSTALYFLFWEEHLFVNLELSKWAELAEKRVLGIHPSVSSTRITDICLLGSAFSTVLGSQIHACSARPLTRPWVLEVSSSWSHDQCFTNQPEPYPQAMVSSLRNMSYLD